MTPEDRERLWLERVCRLCRLLANEHDPESLFAAILDAAIELSEARRGFLVLITGRKPDGHYRFRVREARGFDRRALQSAEGAVSRTAVRRVLDRGRGLVSSHEDDADIVDVTSVRARQTRSILCAPMRRRGELCGALYLDHDGLSEAFSETDLSILETFADQAALALLDLESPPVLDAQTPGVYGGLLGHSAAMQALYERIARVARSSEHVLVSGESGTGKELVARELHARGPEPEAPFVSENCAAIASGVCESELFGHARGAFSGASEDHQGLFERAGVGTLFLDEVAELSPAMQAKLLRVLQERVLRPVGSHRKVPVRCRVIAASHVELAELVRAGRFRADLYYRLDVLRLEVPPLRARRDDIPLLLEHFGAKAKVALSYPPDTLEALLAWSWPGNVRELQNEVSRLGLDGPGPVARRRLSAHIREPKGLTDGPSELAGQTLEEVERHMVQAALESSSWNKSRAARRLGIPRTSLYRLIERYDLEAPGAGP